MEETKETKEEVTASVPPPTEAEVVQIQLSGEINQQPEVENIEKKPVSISASEPSSVDPSPILPSSSFKGLQSVGPKILNPSSTMTGRGEVLSRIPLRLSGSEISRQIALREDVDTVTIKEEDATIAVTSKETAAMDIEATQKKPQEQLQEQPQVQPQEKPQEQPQGKDSSDNSIVAVNTVTESNKNKEEISVETNKDDEKQESAAPSECSETSSEQLGRSKVKDPSKMLEQGDAAGHIGTKPKTRNVRIGFSFEPGFKVEAMDYLNNWYPAKIVRVDWDAEEVQIHFEGWNARYDEWVDFQSERLRPAPRHSNRRDSCSDGSLRRSGEHVLARWTDCRFYPAEIISANSSGSYQVLFYDGIKKTVQAINIRDLPPSLQQDKSKKTSEGLYDKDWSKGHGRRKVERSQSLEGDSPSAPKRRLSGNSSTPVQSKRIRHESMSPRLKGQSISPRSHTSSPASSNTSISSSLGSPITPVLSQLAKKSREPLITDKEVGLLRDPNRKLAPKEMVIDLDHNKYKCDIPGCDKAYRKGSLLDYHKKYYHIGAKPSSYASAASKALNRSRKRLSTPGVVTSTKKSNPTQPAKVQKLRSSAPAAITSKSAKNAQTNKSDLFGKAAVSSSRRLSSSSSPSPAKVSERLKAQGVKNQIEKSSEIGKTRVHEKTIEKSKSVDGSKGKAVDVSKGKSIDSSKGKTIDGLKGKTIDSSKGKTVDSSKGKTVDSSKGKTIDNSKGKTVDNLKGKTINFTKKTIDGSKDISDFGKALTGEITKSLDILKTRRTSGKEENLKLPDKKSSDKIEDRKKSTEKHEKDRSKEYERIKGEKSKSNDKYRSSSSSDRGRSTDRSEHRSSRHHHEKHKKSHKSHRHRDRDSDGSYKHSKKEERHHRKESSSYISQTEEIYVRELTREQRLEMETCEEGMQTEEPYGDEVVHCVCKMNEEDGFMIQCDSCFCWQHSMCVGLNQISVPKKYICCFCQNPSGERTNAKYQHNQEWFKTGELPQFQFSSNRSRENESPTMMLAAHKLGSDIHGVNEMLQGLRQKLKILQSPNELKEELQMWGRVYKEEFEQFRVISTGVELSEEVDSNVDLSVHEKSLQDFIKTTAKPEDPQITTDQQTPTNVSEVVPSKEDDVVSTSASIMIKSEVSGDNVVDLAEGKEPSTSTEIEEPSIERPQEAPKEFSKNVDKTMPISSEDCMATSLEKKQFIPLEGTILIPSEDTMPISSEKSKLISSEDSTVLSKDNLKEETEEEEEEMEIDVVDSDEDDEPLSILKEKWKRSSDEEASETLLSEKSSADISKESRKKLETEEMKKEEIKKEIEQKRKDKDTATPSDNKEKLVKDFPKESPQEQAIVKKDSILQDTSLDNEEMPSTSGQSRLKAENKLEMEKPAASRQDSSIETPIQSCDIPSTSRDIPDIPLISTVDVRLEAEKTNMLDCQLNLLEHVTGAQDDLEERLALIEEQVTALESVYLIPQPKPGTKTSFDDMPFAKRRLKMLMSDLKKVAEIVTT